MLDIDTALILHVLTKLLNYLWLTVGVHGTTLARSANGHFLLIVSL